MFFSVHEGYDFVNAAIGVGGPAYVLKSHVSTDLIKGVKVILAYKLLVSESLLYAQD